MSTTDPRTSRPSAVPSTTVVFAGAALAALPVLYNINPNTTHVPLCPLHALTGLNCPLCGATRATYALLHGQFDIALHDNALYVLGLPFLLVFWWRWYDAVRSGQHTKGMMPTTVSWALIVLAVVFGVVRNLPFGAWLSPPL
jgi:hypothetical protein